MKRTLKEIYPIWSIENAVIISNQGDFTVAFEIVKREIFTSSVADYETLHQTIVKGIKVLPPNSIFHMQDYFTEAKFSVSEEDRKDDFLSRASDSHFIDRPYFEHKSYIFLTKKPDSRRAATAATSTLLKRNLVPNQVLNSYALNEFLDSVGQLQRILEDSDLLKLKRLTDDELWSYAGKMGVLENYFTLNGSEPTHVLRDIDFSDGISIGEKKGVLFTLADAENLPPKCSTRINYEKLSTDRTKFSLGYATNLGLLLPCNHIYNQYIFIGDSRETLKKLESKKLRLQSLSRYSRENAVARDAVDAFLQEAVAEQRLPVKAHFNVFAWADTKEDLKEVKNKISSAIAQMEAHPHIETVSAPQIWWAGIPGNAAELPSSDMFDTFLEVAVCFLNMETNYASSPSPFGLRLSDRLSGIPKTVDISELPMQLGLIQNRNRFVCSASGGGKSFLCNLMVKTYLVSNGHVLIVDVGHSYKHLCDLIGGYYFTYSIDNPIRFNPFYIEDGDFMDIERRESIKTLLLSLWKKTDETYNRSEYVALSNALQYYFEKIEKDRSIFPCFDTFYEFLEIDFTQIMDKEKFRVRDFDLDNFMFVLKPFYKGGEYDYLLNATEQLNLLSERFLVFELDEIKDHPILFPVATIVIMSQFISKMRKLKGVPKVILIEEAWKALMKDGFSEYIKYLYKTARKFRGECVIVTQEIEDIISSPIVKNTIIANSDCKLLLDHSKFQNRFDQIQELLGLSEKEKALILSINKNNDPTKKYKEVFVGLGNGYSKVYRVEVSLEEYLTYTTEENEKVKVKQYAQEYGSMEEGIRRLAAEMRSALISKKLNYENN